MTSTYLRPPKSEEVKIKKFDRVQVLDVSIVKPRCTACESRLIGFPGHDSWCCNNAGCLKFSVETSIGIVCVDLSNWKEIP